ncbi:MAG: DUF2238 domain-containing protein [Planctomycetota bacterium]
MSSAIATHARSSAVWWSWVIWWLTLLAIPASFIGAPYPAELRLQHLPTLVGMAAIGWAIWSRFLSWPSLGCIGLFIWLHLIGARWIYSFVPYDDVSTWLFGISLSDVFGWRRNHYDRLVHFASGVLGVPVVVEVLRFRCRMSVRASHLTAVAWVLAIGAIYEVAEWALAVVMSPGAAEAYNGQQGDIWDPQKDLALAGLGAILAVGISHLWPNGWNLSQPRS